MLPSVNCTLASDAGRTASGCSTAQHCEPAQPAESGDVAPLPKVSQLGFCACPKGYLPSEGGQCADVNECELRLFPCATGAQCTNTAGGYRCSCAPGTQGDPHAGGCQPVGDSVSACSADAQCAADQRCEQRRCVSPCEQQRACAANALCEMRQQRKHCACRAGYEGDGRLSCRPIIDCVTGGSCPGNLHCLQGRCGCAPTDQRVLDYCVGE